MNISKIPPPIFKTLPSLPSAPTKKSDPKPEKYVHERTAFQASKTAGQLRKAVFNGDEKGFLAILAQLTKHQIILVNKAYQQKYEQSLVVAARNLLGSEEDFQKAMDLMQGKFVAGIQRQGVGGTLGDLPIWQEPSVEFVILADTFSEPWQLEQIKLAFEIFNRNPSNLRFRWRICETKDCPGPSRGNHRNEIYMGRLVGDESESAKGQMLGRDPDNDGYMDDADIYLSKRLAQFGKDSFISTTLHELAHAAGLSHIGDFMSCLAGGDNSHFYHYGQEKFPYLGAVECEALVRAYGPRSKTYCDISTVKSEWVLKYKVKNKDEWLGKCLEAEIEDAVSGEELSTFWGTSLQPGNFYQIPVTYENLGVKPEEIFAEFFLSEDPCLESNVLELASHSYVLHPGIPNTRRQWLYIPFHEKTRFRPDGYYLGIRSTPLTVMDENPENNTTFYRINFQKECPHGFHFLPPRESAPIIFSSPFLCADPELVIHEHTFQNRDQVDATILGIEQVNRNGSNFRYHWSFCDGSHCKGFGWKNGQNDIVMAEPEGRWDAMITSRPQDNDFDRRMDEIDVFIPNFKNSKFICEDLYAGGGHEPIGLSTSSLALENPFYWADKPWEKDFPNRSQYNLNITNEVVLALIRGAGFDNRFDAWDGARLHWEGLGNFRVYRNGSTAKAYVSSAINQGLMWAFGKNPDYQDLSVTHLYLPGSSELLEFSPIYPSEGTDITRLSSSERDPQTGVAAYRLKKGESYWPAFTFENLGSEAQKADVKFYLSQDLDFNEGDFLIGQKQIDFPLSFPQVKPIKVQIPKDPRIQPGQTWYIRVEITPEGKDLNPENNSTFLPIIIE